MREAHVTIPDAAFDTMGIGELVSLCREAGLRDLEELACHGDGAVVRVNLAEPLDEDRLASLEYVDWWERVAGSADGASYVVAFTAPGLPDEIADRTADLLGTCDPDVDDGETTLSLVGPQEDIAGTVGEYERAGASPALRKLGAYEGESRPLEELTDRQREVVRTAYEMGYYEVPRTVSTADVAAELDLDPSTVTEHLQRAERNLLTYHL